MADAAGQTTPTPTPTPSSNDGEEQEWLFEEAFFDVLWNRLLDPLQHALALPTLMRLKACCTALANVAEEKIGRALKILMPVEWRKLQGSAALPPRPAVLRPQMFSNRQVYKVVFGLKQQQSECHVFENFWEFARALKARLFEHAVVAACGEGSGRLVAGSWPLWMLLQQEQTQHEDRFLNGFLTSSWKPNDIDVFVQVGVEEYANAVCKGFDTAILPRCAKSAGLADVGAYENVDAFTTMDQARWSMLESAYESMTLPLGDQPGQVPISQIVTELEEDEEYHSFRWRDSTGKRHVLARALASVLRKGGQVETSDLPRWRLSRNSNVTKTWVSADDPNQSWAALNSAWRDPETKRMHAEYGVRTSTCGAARRAALEQKHVFDVAVAKARRELRLKSGRPHTMVNTVPYESVSYDEGGVCDVPFERLVEGFDIVACQTFARVAGDGTLVFAGPGAEFVRSFIATLPRGQESSVCPEMPLKMSRAVLVKHMPALTDIVTPDNEDHDGPLPLNVKAVLFRQLARMDKYCERGFKPVFL